MIIERHYGLDCMCMWVWIQPHKKEGNNRNKNYPSAGQEVEEREWMYRSIHSLSRHYKEVRRQVYCSITWLERKKPAIPSGHEAGWDPNSGLDVLVKGTKFCFFWGLDHVFFRPARNLVSIYEAFCTLSSSKKDVIDFQQMWYNCFAEGPRGPPYPPQTISQFYISCSSSAYQ